MIYLFYVVHCRLLIMTFLFIYLLLFVLSLVDEIKDLDVVYIDYGYFMHIM